MTRCWLAVLMVASCAFPMSSLRVKAAGPALDVGAQVQLFIDHRFIETAENVVLRLNKPMLPEEDVLTFQQPWEQGGGGWATMIEDQGLFKWWYEGDGWDPASRSTDGRFLCYAFSRDGLHWEKPSLGIIEYEGSKKNNIVMAGTWGTVFLDPVAEPEQRYKYLGAITPDSRWAESPGTDGGIYVFFSADGIHWKRVRQPVLPFHCDTRNEAFWDWRIQKYVAYLRSWDPFRRTVSRAEVEDITQPWPFKKGVEPFYKWGKKIPPALTTELPVVLTYDDNDPLVSDHYNLSVVPYRYAQDVYLGFPSAYLHYDGPPYGAPPQVNNPLQGLSTKRGNDGLLDIQVAVSRDGINWSRPDRRPFIGLGLPGSGRASVIYMVAGMIRRGDELWLYYNSSDTTHGGRDRSRGFGPEPEGKEAENYRKEHFRRAVVLLHRFMAASSAWEGGWLMTPPLVFSGSRLELNLDTSAMGVARVEILDGAGRNLEGFSLEDCDPINGNFLHHTVSWNGKTDLSALNGKPMRLRFVSRSTDLYAFQFAP